MEVPDDRLGVMARYRQGPGLLEEVVTGLQDALLDAVPSGGGWTIDPLMRHWTFSRRAGDILFNSWRVYRSGYAESSELDWMARRQS